MDPDDVDLVMALQAVGRPWYAPVEGPGHGPCGACLGVPPEQPRGVRVPRDAVLDARPEETGELLVGTMQAVCSRCQGYGIEPRRCDECGTWSGSPPTWHPAIAGGRDCQCEPLGTRLRWMYDHRKMIRCAAPDFFRVDGQCEALAEFRLLWIAKPEGLALCLPHAQHVARLPSIPPEQYLSAGLIDYGEHRDTFLTYWPSARVLRRAIG